MSEAGALAGVRVLEFSQVVAGPMCGAALAELGADVIKIEPPDGDPHRTRSAVVPLESKTFQALNRGKRSLVLDLADERGRAVVQRMARAADVVLINYRVAASKRMGVDYDTLRALNPKLIYWQNTGFGERGPHAARAGADTVAQAYSGMMATVGKVDPRHDYPGTTSIPFTDLISAAGAAMAICAALYQRALGGSGQYVSTSLLRSSMWAQARQVMREPVHDASLRDPMLDRIHELSRDGAFFRDIVAVREAMNPVLGAGTLYYTAYQAQDGPIVLGAVSQRARDNIRDILGIVGDDSDSPQYDATDPASSARAERVRAQIAAAFRARPVADWMERFDAAGVPASPVNFAEDMADDPQVAAEDLMVDLVHAVTGPQRVTGPLVLMSETPTTVTRPAPALGQHSREVLRDYGIPDNEVDTLVSAGVVVQSAFE